MGRLVYRLVGRLADGGGWQCARDCEVILNGRAARLEGEHIHQGGQLAVAVDPEQPSIIAGWSTGLNSPQGFADEPGRLRPVRPWRA